MISRSLLLYGRSALGAAFILSGTLFAQIDASLCLLPNSLYPENAAGGLNGFLPLSLEGSFAPSARLLSYRCCGDIECLEEGLFTLPAKGTRSASDRIVVTPLVENPWRSVDIGELGNGDGIYAFGTQLDAPLPSSMGVFRRIAYASGSDGVGAGSEHFADELFPLERAASGGLLPFDLTLDSDVGQIGFVSYDQRRATLNRQNGARTKREETPRNASPEKRHTIPLKPWRPLRSHRHLPPYFCQKAETSTSQAIEQNSSSTS